MDKLHSPFSLILYILLGGRISHEHFYRNNVYYYLFADQQMFQGWRQSES